MIPVRSQVLGFGAMVPLAAAAGLAGMAPTARTGPVPRAAIVWAGTVLAFLGGVRRGLSFRNPGGPTARQMGGMARLFGLALAGLLSPSRPVSCLVLAAGFADVAMDDPRMAEAGEAPPFFAELRPPQMAVAVCSLLLLAAMTRRRAG